VSGGVKASGKYSKADMKKLLVGYVALPKTLWTALERGSHVRYIRNDGRFVRGGFVTLYSSQNGRDMLTLANGFNATAKGYSVWTVALDGVKTLYTKKDRVPKKGAFSMIGSKNDEIVALKKMISDLQTRLSALESKSIKK
jgi:hypothetical protein